MPSPTHQGFLLGGRGQPPVWLRALAKPPDGKRASDRLGRDIAEHAIEREFAADVTSFVDMLRSKTEAATGTEPLILVNQDLGITPSSIGADGDYSAADYAASLQNSYQDYDERPRYPWAIPQLSDVLWAPDWSFGRYTQAVDNTRADIQQSTRISPVDNFVLVYAWNEWDEGGTIEPDVEYGCEYLSILQQQLGLQGPGCVPDPSG